jgi:hypothetical protein
MNPLSDKPRNVRVMTYGKDLAAIEHEIVHATLNADQVLVDSTYIVDHIEPKLDGEIGAIAYWAEALSASHGLAWRRVGRDVLFVQGPV